MKFTDFNYKYIFVFICLLGTFLCGYYFKQWYISNNRVKKYISLVYPYSKSEISYGNFENLVKQEFRKQGIEPIFDKFYLNCDHTDKVGRIKYMNEYLNIIKNKPINLILTLGDPAALALLSTHHQILSSMPVVACNVHFPDEELIKEYESRKIYVLRDAPDFKRNIGFIKSLQPHVGTEIIYNIDMTFLGRKSFDALIRSVDRKNLRILGHQSAFSVENEYAEVKDMIESYVPMPAVANDYLKHDELIVSLCPFQYIKGVSLLTMMEESKSEREKKAFLLDKFDLLGLPIVNALNIPSFSCLNEGFGEEARIVGGYMATEEISARVAAQLATRLLNREKVGMPKIRDLDKEYVLDWKYFSAYNNYNIEDVPQNVRIINYPFYERYKKELYILGGLFVFAFILVSIILLRTRQRSLIERKNLKMLKEAHDRLSLSTDGGQISLLNMHGDRVEFDANFSCLTGLEKRHFTQHEFGKYVHPDDLQLFNSFCETLYQFPNMQIQRIRLCFEEKKENYQWYELRCRSLRNAKGEMMLAGIMQNIQNLVEREEQLILAKKIAEKAELKQSFLNNMSHEIRTPLNAIVGFTNLLMGEAADEIDPDERASMVELINHNNELLLKLINDVVEISRLDSGTMDFEIKEWDLTEVIKGIYKTYQPLIQPSLQFRLELDETLSLPVHIDALRLVQVMSNFLSNANKFTQKGHITLGCKIDKQHNEVRVYVEDTGKGIEEKELMMIFDRFYKTDEFGQGSGLGLPISRVIIERLSGRIEVQSEVGKGSCFAAIFALAVSSEKEVPGEKSSSEEDGI